MNAHSLQVLEYHQFLHVLAQYAVAGPTRRRIAALRPVATPADTPVERALVGELMGLRQHEVYLPRAEFDDIEEPLRHAAPADAMLDAESFLLVRRLLATTATVRRFLAGDPTADCPAARDLALDLDDCAEFHDRLRRVFDDEGTIQDGASSKLRDIRREFAALRRRLQSQLDQMLQSNDYDDVFQDRHVALRNGRYVVPVRREMRGKFPGLVHDQSNSGHTLFVEPAGNVEAGNECNRLKAEERDEIQRILRELTATLRRLADTLRANAAALIRYDLARAAATWAVEFEAHYPAVGPLHLRRARHPLLQRQFREDGNEKALVPLDLPWPEDVHVLCITGSNTGGKTVCLKTVGLLVLLAQTGLPITADPESRCPFFPDVVADIGDEQSIQQNLSTFSGHLRQIRTILDTARGGPALALLDELGSGTDPVEGGALGCAILTALADAPGIAMATTHLGMIKNFVHEHDAMVNASVLFNTDTLAPEYVLQLGRPGASHALTIAERNGLPADVLDRARSFMSSDAVRLEEVLAAMDEKERRLDDHLDTAERARGKALKERDALEKELRELRNERRQLLHDARREAAGIVDNAKRDMERLLRDAGKAADKEQARALRDRVDKRQERLAKGIEETKPKPAKPLRRQDLEAGLRVWIENLNDHGRIIRLDKDKHRVTVEVNGMQFEVKAAELGRARDAEDAPEPAPPAKVEVRNRSRGRAALECNLIGLRVEQAIPQLERFLDDAMLTNLEEVRIVHGYGTGALRQAIHEYLATAPVTGFRAGVEGKDAGGAGVTLVRM